MENSASVRSSSIEQLDVLKDVRTVKNIALVLCSGFALGEAADVLEIFMAANALTLAETAESGGLAYQVCTLSACGGRVDSSSFVSVWTEGVEARRRSGGFRALFIGGGAGAHNRRDDERLTAWLRREHPRCGPVVSIGEGRLLLEAAGLGHASRSPGERRSDPDSAQYLPPDATSSTDFTAPMQRALAIVQEDFGAEIARQIADHVLPRPQKSCITATIGGKAPGYVSEKIQASARWLEANRHRSIAISEAARVAAMSERNFLRRFALEMGVRPSEYLLHVRLDMCCRLLAETDLPADKIARRCGLGGGSWLAKVFRKHLATTPSEYRANKRPMNTSSQGGSQPACNGG